MACPNCGEIIDSHTLIDGDTPEPDEGDISVCLLCGQMLWRESEEWRAMTNSELSKILASDKADIFLRLLRAVSEEMRGDKEGSPMT